MSTSNRPSVRRYPADMLCIAEAYTRDKALQRVARIVADMLYAERGSGRVSPAEFRHEVLSGKHSDAVEAYIEREHLPAGEKARRISILTAKLWSITLPAFLTLDVQPSAGKVFLRGAGFTASLEALFRRCGGWRADRQVLVAPLLHADALPAALEEWLVSNRQKRASNEFSRAVQQAERRQAAKKNDRPFINPCSEND